MNNPCKFFINSILFFIIGLFFFSIPSTIFAIGTWQDLIPIPDTRGTYITTTGTDGLIYAVENVADPENISTFMRYDPETNFWTILPSIPSPRVSAGIQSADDGRIYIISGSEQGASSNKVEAFDIQTNTWICSIGDIALGCNSSTIEPIPSPRTSIQGATAKGSDGQIYVLGGYDGSNYLNTAESYNPITNNWTTLPPLLQSADGRAATGADGRIYYMGGTGCPSDICDTLDIVQIFNPIAYTWTYGAPMPITRAQFAIAVGFDQRIYVIGGLHQTTPFPNPSYDILSSVDVYNPQDDSWSSALALPFARSYPAGTTDLNGKIYTIGGTLCICNVFENTVQAYDTAVDQLTALSHANIWVSKRLLSLGLKLDIKADAYKDNTLVSTGQVNSVQVGSGGFNNASLINVPFSNISPVDFPQGSQLKIKLSVRNACAGSLRNQGIARLWFNDSQANSHFRATIGTSNNSYYLPNNFILSTTAGVGPIQNIEIQAGARCSAFKQFGEWITTP